MIVNTGYKRFTYYYYYYIMADYYIMTLTNYDIIIGMIVPNS